MMVCCSLYILLNVFFCNQLSLIYVLTKNMALAICNRDKILVLALGSCGTLQCVPAQFFTTYMLKYKLQKCFLQETVAILTPPRVCVYPEKHASITLTKQIRGPAFINKDDQVHHISMTLRPKNSYSHTLISIFLNCNFPRPHFNAVKALNGSQSRVPRVVLHQNLTPSFAN